MVEEKKDYSEQAARYKAFMTLVGVLAIILLGCTYCLLIGKMAAADYEKVLLMLGVPTLLGMSFHAFFNENTAKEKDNVKTNIEGDVKSIVNATSVEPIKPGESGDVKHN